MRFDLTDLRLFANVHAAGTITGGAEASHMTLASASERIRAMESSLGSALLQRSRRGIALAPAGHTLLHHARLMLQQAEQLQTDLADYGAGIRGHVRLMCNTAASSDYLPANLASFLAEHPGISVDLEERASDAIADAVRHGRCDLGLVADSADLAGLQTFDVRADPLVLVVPRQHALAARAAVGLEDILDQPFVGLAEGSALHEHLAANARRLGRRLNYRVRLRSLESVCRMVGQGIGVAIVPQAVAGRCARSAGISRIRLTDAWATRRLVVCMRDMEALPPHAQALARHLLAPG